MSSTNPHPSLRDLLLALKDFQIVIRRYSGGDMILGRSDGAGPIYVLGHRSASKGVYWSQVKTLCRRFGIAPDALAEKLGNA